jgi:hypothetical protein
MVFISLPKIPCWGNLYSRLPGVLGPALWHRAGLRTPFLFSTGVAGMAAPKLPRVWPSPCCPHLVQHDIPVQSRFLVRPRLLTRCWPQRPQPQEQAYRYKGAERAKRP